MIMRDLQESISFPGSLSQTIAKRVTSKGHARFAQQQRESFPGENKSQSASGLDETLYMNVKHATFPYVWKFVLNYSTHKSIM